MEREMNKERYSYTTPRYNQQYTNCNAGTAQQPDALNEPMGEEGLVVGGG